MRHHLSIVCAASVAAFAAEAKLPPLDDAAKAKAAETTQRAAWTDKVGAYKLCLAMDRTAQAYRTSAQTAGKALSAPEQTPPCADPGPFVATPASAPAPAMAVTPPAQKPLEAAEAHSRPGMATGAPSEKATSAEMTGPRK